MQQSAGSMIVQTESDVSLHQVDSNLLGSQEPDIRYSGIVAHRDYYTLHRGTVSNHGSREDTFVKVLLLNGEILPFFKSHTYFCCSVSLTLYLIEIPLALLQIEQKGPQVGASLASLCCGP